MPHIISTTGTFLAKIENAFLDPQVQRPPIYEKSPPLLSTVLCWQPSVRLAPEDYYIHKFFLPKLSKQDVRNAVELEISSQTPFNESELLLLTQLKEAPKGESHDRILVTCFLIPLQVIDRAMHLHSSAATVLGLRVELTNELGDVILCKRYLRSNHRRVIQTWRLALCLGFPLLAMTITSYLYLGTRNLNQVSLDQKSTERGELTEEYKLVKNEIAQITNELKVSSHFANKLKSGFFSPALTIKKIKEIINQSAEIEYLKITQDLVELHVSAPSIIRVSERLEQAFPGAEVKISGAISYKNTALEQAVLVMNK